MPTRGFDGAALLVAGHASTEPAARALALVGETLLSAGASWRIRRLSPSAGERFAPSRASLRLRIDELTRDPARGALLALAGEVTFSAGEAALVTGELHEDYPDDATLPLSWIRDRLRVLAAPRALILLMVRGDASVARAAHAALATGVPNHAVVTHAAPDGCALIDAALAGLCGDAVDKASGTVTLHSFCEHFARALPDAVLQRSASAEPFATPPPLGGLRDLGRSRLGRMATASATQASDDDLVGVVLPGRFRVERRLARGSFGTVYRARQLSVERDVAVKVLRADLDPSSEEGRLFVHEIQSVGRLDHRNVVRIYQADVTSDGRLFFAMELLVGRDVQRMIDDGRIDRDRALALGTQLLDGLAAVHDAGLVHADVKPANAVVVPSRDGDRLVLLDFGLARLRPPGAAAESAGGTPAYMAPEQLHNQRVDARSDIFSAGLVIVAMLTGWWRRSGAEIVPPLDEIPDDLRPVLARALAVDPAERYQSAADFADALAGRTPGSGRTLAPRAPFRHLAPFGERDNLRFHGRDREIAELTEHVLFRRAVIYTAPSGVGKTSLLRAGLVPRLGALGAHAVYLACRPGAVAALAAAIWPGAGSLADAIARFHADRGSRLVMVVDQIEALFSQPDGAAVIDEVLAVDRWPPDADITVVLSVREDFLARVVALTRNVPEGVAIVRLAPLDHAGARAAIVGPLGEQRLTIEHELLEALLVDLRRAAAALATQLGWGESAAAYPPHLQLACSCLYEALAPGEATLTLKHYRRLGGLDAIVGEHLDRVLDTELAPEDAVVARDLFLELVTAAGTRAFRTDAELIDALGARHSEEHLAQVLDALRSRGLLVRLSDHHAEAGWELVHDSLVPKVHAWIDRRDLSRRRAVELVRYHLRRSTAERPSLLAREELRELRGHEEAIAELDSRRDRPSAAPLEARELLRLSRRAQRQRIQVLAFGSFAALAVIAGTSYSASQAREQQRQEQAMRDRDMGRFSLTLHAFDWDPVKLEGVPVDIARVEPLSLTFHEVSAADADLVGPPFPAYLVSVAVAPPSGGTRHVDVEARGGDGFLVIVRGDSGRRCSDVTIPLKRLPGYAQRGQTPPTYDVYVPTCAATVADMLRVAAGPFIRGGLGVPPSEEQRRLKLEADQIVDLPEFRIDRTEVTNAAFEVFARLGPLTGVRRRTYPSSPELRDAPRPEYPAAGVTWSEARAFCRFMGKDLANAEQWQKALRGGLTLPDGSPNPMPRRNFPWGVDATVDHPGLRGGAAVGPAPVGTVPMDVSPYGVRDLAGNVQEWTLSSSVAGEAVEEFQVARGGNWQETTELEDFTAIDNQRSRGARFYTIGMRCASR